MTVARLEALAPDLVEEVVPLPGGELCVRRPRDSESLLSDEAFDSEELLPYWAELWASAVVLARALAVRSLRGARTLELGCGLGLVGIAAARAGARVTLSDWSPTAVRLAAANAEHNGVVLEARMCSWQEPLELVERAPWDIVLASDVLYDRGNVGLLLGLLPRLAGERGRVLVADPGRPPAEEFLERAAADWAITTRQDGRIALHELAPRGPSG